MPGSGSASFRARRSSPRSAPSVGKFEQLPPAFSARKQGGETAHPRGTRRPTARAGPAHGERRASRPDRTSSRATAGSTCGSTCVCGPGTYVRSIARDLGAVLGCGGHLHALRRREAAGLLVEDAVRPERLEELARADRLADVVLPIAALLPLPQLTLGPTRRRASATARRSRRAMRAPGRTSSWTMPATCWASAASRTTGSTPTRWSLRRGAWRPVEDCRGLAAAIGPAALCMGVFDGVHRGHQALVAATRRAADERGASAVALLFDPPPVEVIRPGHRVPRLAPVRENLRRLREAGADVARWPLDFTPRGPRPGARGVPRRPRPAGRRCGRSS